MAPWLNIQGCSDYKSWLRRSMAPWLSRQELPTTDIPCTPWLPVAVWLPVAIIPKNKSTKPQFSQVRTKIIALGWYCITMIFFGAKQILKFIAPKAFIMFKLNQDIIVLINESVLKMAHFWVICGAFFIDNMCLYLYFSQKINCTAILNINFWLRGLFSFAILPVIYGIWRVKEKYQQSLPSGW